MKAGILSRGGWVGFLLVLGAVFGMTDGVARATCRGMSVEDMISVTRFISPFFGSAGDIRRSPDGRYVAVVTQSGDVRDDVVRDELLVWRVRDISRWLPGASDGDQPKPAVQFVVQSGNKFQGSEPLFGVIRDVKWTADSKGILFRARKPGSREFGLYRGALDGTEKLLSAADQDVVNYAVRGGEVVYEAAVSTRKERAKQATEEDARPYFVGTGRTLYNLLFPRSWLGAATDWVTVWRISRGSRERVPLRSRQSEVSDDRHMLSISPNGEMAIMDLPVRYVPAEWNKYGRLNYPVWPRTGPVELAGHNMWVPHEFTLIRLRSGGMEPVVAAPDGFSRMFFHFWLPGEHGGRYVSTGASWAPSGTALLLRNTFLPQGLSGQGLSGKGDSWGVKRPCIAVVDVEASRSECVESLVNGLKDWTLMTVQWAPSAPDAIVLTLKDRARLKQVAFCLYQRSDTWLRRCGNGERSRSIPVGGSGGVRVWVAQSLNSPPRLVAARPGDPRGRTLFDPNAKLRARCIGTARTVSVGIGRGEQVKLGLLLPVNYVRGRRYPLVIQTHGYQPHRFLSAGLWGAFAARAFAASGIAVLQAPTCPMTGTEKIAPGAPMPLAGTADELSCNVQIFRAGIRYVVGHGLVDSSRVGIIGFSKTSEYVLAALERDGDSFAAAEVIDGDMNTYTQYVAQVGMFQGYINVWEEATIGGPPMGAGLAAWVARSPGFSIYKIRAPMLIQADGRQGVLEMWEPYAVLHQLRRPVDFVVIQAGTHPVSNPLQREASEGMTVDWFRFWLQHKRPADEAEYERWSSLRETSQGSSDAKAATGSGSAVRRQERSLSPP